MSRCAKPLRPWPASSPFADCRRGAFHTGVASSPRGRLVQHREGLIPGFTKAYGVRRLVRYEMHETTMKAAILCEKRIKEWRRAWQIELIEARNEHWDDLAIGLGRSCLPPVAVGA